MLRVQCGTASQPILSLNYGARQTRRILDVLRYALGTVAVFGVLWVLVLAAFPTEIVRLFMAPTPEVLEVAPGILRTYGLSFLLLPFNIFSAYYFQSILRPVSAFGISVTRGLVVSGGLILTLPALWGGSAHLAGDAADRAGGGAGCGGVDGPFRPAAQGGALMKKTRPEAVPPGALR